MATFYDLTESERVALTELVITDRRTLIERWAVLEDAEANPWSERSAAAAELLKLETGVLDLGCGTMILEKYLACGIEYWPCDVVRRDERTIVCDLNLENPPSVAASAVACLGLIEYLHDPVKPLRSLGQSYKTMVVSYCTTDSPVPASSRRAHAWVNDYDRAGIERVFLASGWEPDFFAQQSDLQAIWRLKRD